jgi:hypothetical protein
LGGLCLIVIVLAGYDKTDGAEIDAKDVTNALLESEASKGWTTPSDVECREFAKAFESAVANGDTKAMEEMFDWDAVLERVTAGIKGVDKGRRQFIGDVPLIVKPDDGLLGKYTTAGMG